METRTPVHRPHKTREVMSLHPTFSSSSPLLQGQRLLPGLRQGLNLGPTVCLLEGTLSSTRDRERANIIKIIVKRRNGQKVGTLRPTLKFYLFPLTRLTLKKGPTQTILFQFSVKNYFFLISLQLRKLSNVNSVILVDCLCI